jgi:hypothetical protein
MKRLLLGLLLALCLVVPIGASADPPTKDKVDGTLEDIFPSTLHVNAISDANGANARGHFWYELGDPATIQVAGEVTCMNVQGNVAAVGARIDRSKLPGLPGVGNGAVFYITDNGEPGDMDVHWDTFQVNPPTSCPFINFGPFPSKHGNFIVQDAP